MNNTVLNIDEIDWKDVPIKLCEFKRCSKEFVHMDRSEIEFAVMNLVLGCLSEEDQNIITKTVSPTLDECIKGSKEIRSLYLSNIMKLLVLRYKQQKLRALRSSSHLREACERRSYQHYEALRNLKRLLLQGKDLLERDMPVVEAK